MSQIKSIGKFLDQPILLAKLNKSVPYLLTAGSGAFCAKEIYNAPQDKKKDIGVKSGIILASTALAAICAPKIACAITGRTAIKTLKEVKNKNLEIINEYKKNKPENELNNILEKAKTKILSLKDVHTLFSKDKELGNKLIPPPDNITSKDIFKEIGWLSIYGFVPVAGGLAGGVIADKTAGENWEKKAPDKINEGVYQYLANIFLCNIGAGTALGILEKFNIKSKTARCLGMISGILLTGVIGGSLMANYIGNKVVNPLISKNRPPEKRTPELLDLSLHSDDIATISLLSGLKWIEPSLPLLYSVSGYRAGIGYRNNRPKELNTEV